MGGKVAGGCPDGLSFPVMTNCVKPKPTTKKNKGMSRGSIFLPLVANLEHTHMKFQSSICNPIHSCKVKEFQNLLVTGGRNLTKLY
jgi:hypothetical protein